MTCVCVTYICYAKIGLNIPLDISTWIGIAAAVGSLGLFLVKRPVFAANPVA
jgi:hypothetical protein